MRIVVDAMGGDLAPQVNVEGIVADIIADVRKNGDEALYRYCEKFDGAKLDSLEVSQAEIDEALALAQGIDEPLSRARAYHDSVLGAMDRLRTACDAMENIVSTDAWPLPTYNKMLFYC